MQTMTIRLFATAFLAAILSACAADPAGPDAAGANSFGVSRTGGASATLTLTDSSSRIAWDSGAIVSTLTAVGTTSFAKPAAGSAGDHPLKLTITFPANVEGTYTWSDLTDTSSSEATGLVITIDGVEYKAVHGTTIVTSYGAVGGLVTGSFSGVVRSGAGDSLAIHDGRFSAVRGTDIAKAPAGSSNQVTFDGDGRSHFTIDLGSDAAGMSRVEDNSYISVLVSGTERLIKPGVTGSVSITIEYPAVTMGTRLWSSTGHAKIQINLGDDVYLSRTGFTNITQLGSTFGTLIAGTFGGEMVNNKTGATVQVSGGRFAEIRFN